MASTSPLSGDIPDGQEKWNGVDDAVHESLGPRNDNEHNLENGGSLGVDEAGNHKQEHTPVDFRSDGMSVVSASKGGSSYREKQVKPNKVYIGGLPEHTRQEDLRSCFGKIGSIINIELKLGYGFVEFDSREAAEESVAKYHEGFFMGNKIRVEFSHGGGRTAKFAGEPGACFKCGQMGHWARECPNHVVQGGPGQHPRPGHHGPRSAGEGPYPERPLPARDYSQPPPPPPPPRDFMAYPDEPTRYPPPRDARYPGYEYPPAPAGREYGRPPSPQREYRDYSGGPRPPREYDDYRGRGPPPPNRGYYPPEATTGYPARPYAPAAPPPPPREIYDRAPDRRAAPPAERYQGYPPSGRPRSPVGAPTPRGREDYDRAPPRDYPPAVPEYRGRPVTPPPPPARYGEYPHRGPGGEANPSGGRPNYRRRSQSPVGRAGYRAPGYMGDQAPDAVNFSPTSQSYSSRGNYNGAGYMGPNGSAPPRGGVRDRDYAPRAGGEPGNNYSRRT